jgi:Ca2+-binding EF-hand superfamily protein
MSIFENIKAPEGSEATNCFVNTKKEIADFFKFLDCDKDGYIDSESLYHGF